MKALSILQPWAELIRCGEKRIENRTWPTVHRGWLAIHAGKSKREFGGAGGVWLANGQEIKVEAMAFGAIVALGWLEDCVRLDRLPKGYGWVANNYYASGPWCWHFSRVLTLTEPVACRGALGLFKVPAELEPQVLARVEGTL